MKKVLAILFAVFYFTATSGVTVHMHYCMDKLANVNFSETSSKSCGKCGMHKDKSKDCCKETKSEFKVEKNQQLASYAFKIGQVYAIALLNSISGPNTLTVPAGFVGHPQSHAPPLRGDVPAFILNCTYRI